MSVKVIVTGATGFVGANLLRKLLENKFDVYAVVRQTSNFWRLEDIIPDISELLYVDLSCRNSVFNLVHKIKPSIIYHLACYGGYPDQQNKQIMIESNLLSTINLVDAALEFNVSQFINTGSSSEYGIKNRPMKEDDFCEPINFYGITKLAATNYCTMVGRLNNYRICTLRLFSPYGKYEDPKRLYPSILNAVKNGERPKLSNPCYVRDFIEIERVVDVYLKIVKSEYQPGDILNIGSGKQQTIKEFVDYISSSLGTEINPIWGHSPARPFEPDMWEADISKLKNLINF